MKSARLILALSISIFLIGSVQASLDMRDYPDFFVKDNQYIGYFVKGDTADPSDLISITNMMAEVQSRVFDDEGDIIPIPVEAFKLSSEISNPLNSDLITVGTPCGNPITAAVLGTDDCHSGLSEGHSVIRLFNNNGKHQVVVAGYDNAATRVASIVLSNLDDYDLRGDKICVTGTLVSPVAENCGTIPPEEVEESEEETEAEEYDGEIDLRNYPALFFDGGDFEGFAVIGDDGTPSDVLSLGSIVMSLQVYAGHENQLPDSISQMAFEADNLQSSNIISVGDPCGNTISAMLIGLSEKCDNWIAPGEAVLHLFNYNGNIQLLVAGYGPEETRDAAAVLADWEQYDLEGRTVCVYGTAVRACGRDLFEDSEFLLEGYYEKKEETVEEVAPEPEIEPEPEPEVIICEGCMNGKECVETGKTTMVDGVENYCDTFKTLKQRKDSGTACSYNFECLTDRCVDNLCFDPDKPPEEKKGLVGRFFSWLKSIFT